jgi:hypothetical protein
VTAAPSFTEAETKAISDLMTLTDEVVGQEIMGVNITHSIAKELYSTAKQQLATTFNGKGYDVETAFKNAWTIKMLPFIVKNEAKNIEHATMKRLFKEFHSPSTSGKPIETNPNATPQLTDAQKMEKDLQDKVNQKADPMGLNKK